MMGKKVYLLTKNLLLPKGRASKLLPKYVKLYTIVKVYSETSSYEIDLFKELKDRCIHLQFHVSLLRKYIPNNKNLFPN